MSKKRQPTENEMGLHAVLNNGYLAPEIRNVRMWEFIEAIINENMEPALSRARAEALEEAKQRILKRCCSNMVAHGHCEHQPCDYYQNALTEIHALITTPAPATIPVERVRAILLSASAMLNRQGYGSGIIRDIARDLGVTLDAKGNGHG